MTPEPSWTDRLLPDWMGGSSDRARSPGGGGDGPEHERILARLEQLREGLDRAATALPEDDAALGRRAVEASTELSSRVRAAADGVEESGGSPGEEALAVLRKGGRALHDAHYHAVRIRVERDRGEEASMQDAREGLEASTEEMLEAASELEALAASR